LPAALLGTATDVLTPAAFITALWTTANIEEAWTTAGAPLPAYPGMPPLPPAAAAVLPD
jgi:hypothetical protein